MYLFFPLRETCKGDWNYFKSQKRFLAMNVWSISTIHLFIHISSTVIMSGVILIRQVKKLQILQNKARCIITGSPSRTNNETLYKQNCILNLNTINTHLVGKFIYDHCIVPDIFKERCVCIKHMVRYHDTSISVRLHLPTTSSNLSRNSIR